MKEQKIASLPPCRQRVIRLWGLVAASFYRSEHSIKPCEAPELSWDMTSSGEGSQHWELSDCMELGDCMA